MSKNAIHSAENMKPENGTDTLLSVAKPTPTQNNSLPKRMADFETLSQALDYAAQGETGHNFYSSKGMLEYKVPYKDLRDKSILIARQLLTIGLKREDRVAVIADMHPDFIALFLACQYAGLYAVPLPALSGLGSRAGYESQIERILRTSGAKVAFGPEKFMDSLEKGAEGLNLEMVGTVSDLPAANVQESALHPLQKDEISHIQFSSGSTRKPLGIQISQKSMMANAKSVALHGLCFREDDRVASWLPFYHDMGLIGFLLIPMTTQMSVDYLYTDGFARRPLGWLSIISKNKCTMSFSPSFGYDLCSRRIAKQKDIDLDLSSWRIAGIGGDMVQPDALDKFSACFAPYGFRPETFVPSYGLAEMTLAFSFSPLDTGVETDLIDNVALIDEQIARPAKQEDTNTRLFAKCGTPLEGYEVDIRDEDSGKSLSGRKVGGVYIKGPAMMSCYDNNPEETDAIMAEDGWMNTGDMGYMTDGDLVITGRIKDLIIVNGRNIWPQDLEWQVEQDIDAVPARGTAAFAIQQENVADTAVMLVHCKTQDKQEQEALRKDIQSVIFKTAGIQCQVIFIRNGTLPFTTSGKLSRSRAKKNFLKGQLEHV